MRNFLFYMFAEYQEREKKQRKKVETNSISNVCFTLGNTNEQNSPVQHCWELSRPFALG